MAWCLPGATARLSITIWLARRHGSLSVQSTTCSAERCANVSPGLWRWKEFTGFSCCPIDKQANPLASGGIKSRQRFAKRQGHPEVRTRTRAPAYRISLDRKPDSPERADRARHVLRRGYEEPALTLLRIGKRFCEGRIFGGVAGARLQQNTPARNTKTVKHLVNELRFRRLIAEQARIAAGIYDPCIRKDPRKLPQSNDTIAVAPDYRFAKLTRQAGVERATQNNNAVRRAAVWIPWWKAAFEDVDQQIAGWPPARDRKQDDASNIRPVPARFLPVAKSTAPTIASPIRILEDNKRNATLLESRKNISVSSSSSHIAFCFLRWADKARAASDPSALPEPTSSRVVRARLLHARRSPQAPLG